MPVSDYEGDATAYRDQSYAALRSAFIDDDGDSTFATDDASTADEPDVSVWQAMLWGIATMLGHTEEQLQRAGDNRNPALAQELLGLLEEDYRVVPAYNATIPERQAALALRARVANGASRPAIEAALTELLGADFVAYETNDDVADVTTWPSSPGTVGVFDAATAERKIFRLLGSVSLTNQLVSVAFEAIGDSTLPQDGEVYCFDPNACSPNIEQVTVVSVAGAEGARVLSAVFTRPHPAGTLACRPHPVWLSSQRCSRVVLSFAAAIDPGIRQKVNDYLSRTLRGVSQWSICGDQGTLLLGHATRGILGATALSTTAVGAGGAGNAYAAGFAGATSSAHAVGSSVMAGAAVGAASGASTAGAVGVAIKGGAASASGTSSGVAIGTAQKRSVAAGSGTSICVAVGLRGPYGTAAGTSTAAATGIATKASVGSASGLSTCTGIGAAQARGVGAASGTASVLGKS